MEKLYMYTYPSKYGEHAQAFFLRDQDDVIYVLRGSSALSLFHFDSAIILSSSSLNLSSLMFLLETLFKFP